MTKEEKELYDTAIKALYICNARNIRIGKVRARENHRFGGNMNDTEN